MNAPKEAVRQPSRDVRGPIRVELPVSLIRLAQPPSPVEEYACHELQRFLHVLFGIQAAVDLKSREPREAHQGPQFVMAVPAPDHPWRAALDNSGCASLDAQEYRVQTIAWNGRPAVLLAGGSPAALLWAVYELAEFWGARFLLTHEVLPHAPRPLELPQNPIRRRPLIALRAWRGINHLPHSGSYWGLKDHQSLIDRLARMRFNCFYAMVYPYMPFIDYQWEGVRKRTAEMSFGWRFPIDEQTIGREKFGRVRWFENPDIPYEGAYDQKLAAATRLIDGIQRHAQARGMSFGLRFLFTEFPEEFKERLRELSIEDGFAPAEQESGYVYRLGVCREGMDPTYSPYMSIRNPRFVDLVATQLRAYLSRYGSADYLVLQPPEFPNASADAEFAWKRLSPRYGLGPVEELARLIADAAGELKNDPNPVSPERIEQQIRGHVCTLYLLDQLLSEQGLIGRGEPIRGRLVAGLPLAALGPLTARILGADVDLMATLGSGYLASDAAHHADQLEGVCSRGNSIHLTVSVEDDNIGLTPQFGAPSLHTIATAMRCHKVTGMWCRQWLLSKLEPAAFYLARACWDETVTPRTAADDLIGAVCGERAVGPLGAAFQLGEQITLENDSNGHIHSFLTPSLLGRYWDSAEPPKPSMVAMRARYQQLQDLLVDAHRASSADGRAFIDQFISQARFAREWIDVLSKVAAAGQARASAERARAGGDVERMDRNLKGCVEALDEALGACRGAVEAWADAVRDRADLGALAALNHYGYRYLLALRHVQELKAEQWACSLGGRRGKR